MYIRFKDGKQRVVTLSYDDAVYVDIRLIDIMNKYGLKGTFNVNSSLYMPEENERDGHKGLLKLSEAKKLYLESGNEVAVHTLTHSFLDQLDECEIIREIIEDRKSIEKEYGVIAKGMAYPYGTYNDKVIEVLKNCGISYARTTRSTEGFGLPKNWLTWNPTCHHNNPRLMELARDFAEKERWGTPRMFYLWGHTFEFNTNKNWNVIEEFAEYIGNREDIWYATNIEIYNYVKAYESLITSYDKKIIHNPSATDVWVFIDGETIVIKAGETVYR